MITRVRATMSMHSRLSTPDVRSTDVTTALGIAPTSSWEYGDPHRGPRMAARGIVRSHAYWSYTEPRTMANEEDPHGMESLVRLTEGLEPHAATLERLREQWDMAVWMFGASDSWNAGFVIGPATLRRLGAIGAPLYPDLYMDGPNEMTAEELAESAALRDR